MPLPGPSPLSGCGLPRAEGWPREPGRDTPPCADRRPMGGSSALTPRAPGTMGAAAVAAESISFRRRGLDGMAGPCSSISCAEWITFSRKAQSCERSKLEPWKDTCFGSYINLPNIVGSKPSFFSCFPGFCRTSRLADADVGGGLAVDKVLDVQGHGHALALQRHGDDRGDVLQAAQCPFRSFQRGAQPALHTLDVVLQGLLVPPAPGLHAFQVHMHLF
mmetsp:Transcript_72935/g.235849  ORF Transcript_72935/g.235849 Transcript_72935/m.235849 type:complete len:219 (+) Transcript_72935:185-841(+)